MNLLLLLAGYGQLALAGASLGIPRELGWREQTRALDPLTRHVFWTYAAYILGTNVAMGLLCVLAPEWLLDGSPLAVAVSAYVFLYWGARFVLQMGPYRKHAPKGLKYRVVDVLVTLLFAYLTGVFGWIVGSSLLG